MLTGLNHITLAVNDLEKSFTFYTELLSFKARAKWKRGAYLSLGDLWLCLSVDESKPSRDYSHIAFSIPQQNFPALSSLLISNDVKVWKENKSEGDSLYFLDPDGHKLEAHVGDLQSRLESIRLNPYEGLTLFND